MKHSAGSIHKHLSAKEHMWPVPRALLAAQAPSNEQTERLERAEFASDSAWAAWQATQAAQASDERAGRRNCGGVACADCDCAPPAPVAQATAVPVPAVVRMLTDEEIYCAWDGAGSPVPLPAFALLVNAACNDFARVNGLTIEGGK